MVDSRQVRTGRRRLLQLDLWLKSRRLGSVRGNLLRGSFEIIGKIGPDVAGLIPLFRCTRPELQLNAGNHGSDEGNRAAVEYLPNQIEISTRNC
jgi:hypothetical protein